MEQSERVNEHQVLTRDGRTLLVLERGDPGGHPVLVHNGIPNSRLTFDRDVARAQAHGIRLISYTPLPRTPTGRIRVKAEVRRLANLDARG